MTLRRTLAALMAPLALAAAAEAQAEDPPQSAANPNAFLTTEAAAGLRDRERLLRVRSGDALGEDGMLAAADLGAGTRVGIGRFRVPEPAEPRSWMEREADPTDMRRDDQGIAAIGLRMPF